MTVCISNSDSGSNGYFVGTLGFLLAVCFKIQEHTQRVHFGEFFLRKDVLNIFSKCSSTSRSLI